MSGAVNHGRFSRLTFRHTRLQGWRTRASWLVRMGAHHDCRLGEPGVVLNLQHHAVNGVAIGFLGRRGVKYISERPVAKGLKSGQIMPYIVEVRGGLPTRLALDFPTAAPLHGRPIPVGSASQASPNPPRSRCSPSAAWGGCNDNKLAIDFGKSRTVQRHRPAERTQGTVTMWDSAKPVHMPVVPV